MNADERRHAGENACSTTADEWSAVLVEQAFGLRQLLPRVDK
jgi:hypothetical protein